MNMFAGLLPWNRELARLRAIVATLELKATCQRVEIDNALKALARAKNEMASAKEAYDATLINCALVINTRLERQRELYAKRDLARLQGLPTRHPRDHDEENR